MNLIIRHVLTLPRTLRRNACRLVKHSLAFPVWMQAPLIRSWRRSKRTERIEAEATRAFCWAPVSKAAGPLQDCAIAEKNLAWFSYVLLIVCAEAPGQQLLPCPDSPRMVPVVTPLCPTITVPIQRNVPVLGYAVVQSLQRATSDPIAASCGKNQSCHSHPR